MSASCLYAVNRLFSKTISPIKSQPNEVGRVLRGGARERADDVCYPSSVDAKKNQLRTRNQIEAQRSGFDLERRSDKMSER